MLQKPRGTRDFLPDEMEQRRDVEQTMREAARRWGYREVCTPTFEQQELYTIKSGNAIISEMYTFNDKGGRPLALRPEGTAAILRMYVNEAKVMAKPIRWCYLADCYRYERPQKGRYRQFWQFGAELIGADTPAADAEIVLLADEILRPSQVRFDLHVGHLAPMKHLLRDLAPGKQQEIMALLDKRNFEGVAASLAAIKNEELAGELEALVNCRTVDDAFAICGDLPEKTRIEEMIAILDGQELAYQLNLGIVRGLDYYTGMVFEGFADNLGAENQIIGGGSYRLAHLFGGEDVSSVGFGIGFDRVMVARGEIAPPAQPVVAIVSTPEAQDWAFSVGRAFRNAGIRTELNLLERGLGAQIKHAAKRAGWVLVIGGNEAAAQTVTIKNMATGEQQTCTVQEAVAEVTV